MTTGCLLHSDTGELARSVLIVNRFASNSAAPTARMADDLADSLRAAGHDVALLTGQETYSGNKRRRGMLSDARQRLRVWVGLYLRLVSAIRGGRYDRIVFMTDPPLMPFVWRVARQRHSRAIAIWWTMDLYPEAFEAAGILRRGGILALLLRRLNNWGLKAIDRVAALGECQLSRLKSYPNWRHDLSFVRVVPPWDIRPELLQPHDPNIVPPGIEEWEGKKVALYAGNLGRAHLFEPFLEAARTLAEIGDSWVFAFYCRGERKAALIQAANGLDNVVVRDYVSPAHTAALLDRADVHLVSMSVEWEGVVVPSKLYGVAWTGAPVLFAGPSGAETAREIARFDLGKSFPSDSEPELLADALRELAERPRRVSLGLANQQKSGPANLAAFIASTV